MTFFPYEGPMVRRGGASPVQQGVSEITSRMSDDMEDVGSTLMLVGIVICLVALAKLVTSIGLLLRKNWARVGLIVCASLMIGLQLMILFSDNVSGSPGPRVGSLLLNGAIIAYLFTPKLKAAME